MRRAPLWFLAGVLATLAVELAAWPLWHRAEPVGDAASEPLSSMPLADITAALEGSSDSNALSAAGAGAAAEAVGPDSGTPGAGSMQSAVARLEARLSGTGGSAADWELLAKSYDFMGRHADAALARSRRLPPSATNAPLPATSAARAE